MYLSTNVIYLWYAVFTVCVTVYNFIVLSDAQILLNYGNICVQETSIKISPVFSKLQKEVISSPAYTETKLRVKNKLITSTEASSVPLKNSIQERTILLINLTEDMNSADAIEIYFEDFIDFTWPVEHDTQGKRAIITFKDWKGRLHVYMIPFLLIGQYVYIL